MVHETTFLSLQTLWSLTIQTASHQDDFMFQNTQSLDFLIHCKIRVICFHKSSDRTFMFPQKKPIKRLYVSIKSWHGLLCFHKTLDESYRFPYKCTLVQKNQKKGELSPFSFCLFGISCSKMKFLGVSKIANSKNTATMSKNQLCKFREIWLQIGFLKVHCQKKT